MSNRSAQSNRFIFSVVFVVAVVLVFMVFAEAAHAAANGDPYPAGISHPGFSAIASAVTSGRQAMIYRRILGIDDLHIRSTASGSLIRFSYRIVDAEKAKPLNDKKFTPLLVDEKTGLALQVPVMEKVGQLRQVATPQNGREYWMAFSNKGRYVSPGNHVDIVVGKFRIRDLVVEGLQRSNAANH
jgi:hypothetical protein